MINRIKSFFFGVRVQGEPVRLPLNPKYECVTRMPSERVGLEEWFKEYRVSSLYYFSKVVY